MSPKRNTRDITRRRFLRSTVTSALAFSAAPKFAGAADNTTPSHPSFTNLKDLLVPIREANDLPALGAAVMKGGTVVASGVVGVRKVGDPTPVTISDKFHLGSCTKAFTATLAGMLVDQGKIRWTSTFAEIFPERAAKFPDYASVTLELLLWHRSGVPFNPPADWWKTYTSWCSSKGLPPGAYPAAKMDPRIIVGRLEYMDLVLAQPPVFKPGTGFRYCNNAYVIAGCMMERVTGVPWEDLIRQRLFIPLGMSSAGYGPCQKQNQTDQPWGHHLKEGKFVPTYGDNPEVIGPSSTIHCSLADYLKFGDLHASVNKRGPRLVSDESFVKLHAPHADQEYAMGWGSGEPRWAKGRGLWHTGSNTSNYVLVRAAPSLDLSLIVATNCTKTGDFAQGASPNGKKTDQILTEVADEVMRRLV